MHWHGSSNVGYTAHAHRGELLKIVEGLQDGKWYVAAHEAVGIHISKPFDTKSIIRLGKILRQRAKAAEAELETAMLQRNNSSKLLNEAEALIKVLDETVAGFKSGYDRTEATIKAIGDRLDVLDKTPNLKPNIRRLVTEFQSILNKNIGKPKSKLAGPGGIVGSKQE